jgi:GT2 family glycosyltransferase/SAM-dependent methyltransferase
MRFLRSRQAAEAEYEVPPGSDAEIAAALNAGRPMMWCEWPVPGRETHVRDGLLVHGWAHSTSGIVGVGLLVDGATQLELDLGPIRPEVGRTLGITDGPQSFAGWVDTERWAQAAHGVAVVATDRNGSRVGQEATVTVSPHGGYRQWLAGHLAGRAARGLLVASDSVTPLSLVALGEPSARLSESLAAQTDTNFETQSADSPAEAVAALARGGAGGLVVVEGGGRLDPEAVSMLSATLASGADLVYADEDAIVEDEGRGADYLKPGWSPELLLSTDYVGPLVAVSPRAARAALERGERPPETIYELCIRLIDAGLRIARIAEVLYTADQPRIPQASDGVLAEIESLGRRLGHIPRIESSKIEGARRVGWELQREPLVSVIIPSSFGGGLLPDCLDSIQARSSYRNLEVLIVDSSSGRIEPTLSDRDDFPVRVVPFEGRFNFSTACNLGAAEARGEYLVFLNDDTEVITPEWVERMLEHAQLPGVGVVGTKLLFPNGLIQHGGVNLLPGAGMAVHQFARVPDGRPGYQALLELCRNASAVTAACMMMPTALFEETGGFDEGQRVEYGDTDLCLKAVEAGRRVVWTPHARLHHHERVSRDVYLWDEADHRAFASRWEDRYRTGDPLYHPAFRAKESFEYDVHATALGVDAQSDIGAEVSVLEGGDEQASDLGGPVPPFDLIFRVHGPDPGSFDRIGRRMREEILALLGDDFSLEGKRVLDFGCGPGRTMRHFHPEAQACEIWGSDIDARSVGWVEQHLCPPFHVAQNGELPPLPFPDGHFDLVWAISVFTHLTDTWAEWLAELHRVLADDGFLIVTYHGAGNAAGNPFMADGWREERIGMTTFAHGEICRALGPAVYHSQWWIHTHWGRAFEVMDGKPAGFTSADDSTGQGILLLRKKPGPVSAEELEQVDPDDDRELEALRFQCRVLSSEAASSRAEGDARTAELEQGLRQVQGKRDELEARLETVLRSRSWRVTSPLRRLGALARRGRKAPRR